MRGKRVTVVLFVLVLTAAAIGCAVHGVDVAPGPLPCLDAACSLG